MGPKSVCCMVEWGRGSVWGSVYGCRYMLADRSVSGRLDRQNEHTNVCPSDPSIRRSVDPTIRRSVGRLLCDPRIDPLKTDWL